MATCIHIGLKVTSSLIAHVTYSSKSLSPNGPSSPMWSELFSVLFSFRNRMMPRYCRA